MANKLCAQQTAKICRKAPKGIFDSLKKDVPRHVLSPYLRSSAVLSEEEQGQRARAGVGTDHRAYIADDHFLYTALLLELLG